MAKALIFDFDGVVADSEVLANTVLAEIVTELRVPTTVEDSYRCYLGKRFGEIITEIEKTVGRTLPPTFAAQFQARTLDSFRRALVPIAGMREFIAKFSHVHGGSMSIYSRPCSSALMQTQKR
ncbi:HAD family phosphatase [Bradyrhizobium sp. Arg68]|uniref:HAD hydrolase-like protein n=1 Tax=Bradyrhizobium ivorense TaxID=2511166 RepID=UPI003557ADC0|nr:HAD family phosphatase [Bradyrhizobium ivorense]